MSSCRKWTWYLKNVPWTNFRCHCLRENERRAWSEFIQSYESWTNWSTTDECAVDQKHFFGAVYDKSGIRPDPIKVDEIKKLPSQTDLQKVLGIITYVTLFILHLSDLTAPMRNLLKKETEYKWTISHKRALQKIKDLICSLHTLTHKKIQNKKTSIQVDASNKGLVAVLLQEGKPIAFASKAQTETEQRYVNIERELLAVVFVWTV